VRAIDGRAHANAISRELATDVARLRVGGVTPRLAVVVPTDDPATAWYVRTISRLAGKVGVECVVDSVAGADRSGIVSRLAEWSGDPTVHGVICQTPLPSGIALADVASAIAPAKDVDGANPVSLGRLADGLEAYPPATAAAVLEILRRENVPLRGADVVVVGRSTVVGKPVALLLIAADATVTVCHSRTVDLAAVTARASVLVVAAGRAGLITADYIRPGAVVIDVGTNPTADGGMVGDVDPDALEKAGAYTPVPGGVGPVTTAMLLRATVTAAKSARSADAS